MQAVTEPKKYLRADPPVKIGKFFSSAEFQCHCGKCPFALISPRLVELLDEMRRRIGLPIQITSGFRCKSRQEKLRREGYETAKGVSSHELGLAADIVVRGKSGRELEAIARAVGFQRVGVSDLFVHVDLKPGVNRWVYKSALQSGLTG